MADDRSVLSRPAPAPTRTWRYGRGADHTADVYLPAHALTSTPVVLVHGGYWRPEYDRSHLRPIASALAEAGWPTVLLGYSRIPGDPDAAVADLRDALLHADDVLGGSPGVLVGHSAGGHLALLLAADDELPLLGCLALAPVADLHEADRLDLDEGAVREFLGARAPDRPDLDPVHCAPVVPVRVLHGDSDDLVPVQLSRSYCDAQGAHLRVLPGIGHFAVIDPLSPVWPVVLAELDVLDGAAGIE